MLNPVTTYLTIGRHYSLLLDYLRWSELGDAIERTDGTTFCFAAEAMGFLEGFAAHRPLIHFNFIVHLLHLLRAEVPSATYAGRSLSRSFREAGRLHRSAGAFCAVICQEVPAEPDAPAIEAIWEHLVLRETAVAFAGLGIEDRARSAPWTADRFERHVHEQLDLYSADEIRHWLHHGQGPVAEAGDEIARALAPGPRPLPEILAEVSARDRLAGAAPFVAQLVSALSLPPRRLDDQHLPMGGYADVSNRGRPEALLPSQFAYDDIEFLRRHAERELLYFRREAPQSHIREELVVLLDQGVRTWGTVRLVLTAAVFALAALASRRKLSFFVGATSKWGALCDPLTTGAVALAEVLEASDLSANPGQALEDVLEQPTSVFRDIVLLTHPRNLIEADVAAAARRLQRPARLFALAVDEHGAVDFSELKQGVPVSRARFGVDFNRSVPPVAEHRPTTSPTSWTGDVEPVPFPFRFGIGAGLNSPMPQFAFDVSGEWLLTANVDGMLHATRTDGSRAEILPRPLYKGQLIRTIFQVVGVRGGFAVVGSGAPPSTLVDSARSSGTVIVAAHYDIVGRSCKVHELLALRTATTQTAPGQPTVLVWYLGNLHTLVVSHDGENRSLHLATGSCKPCRASTVTSPTMPSISVSVPAGTPWTSLVLPVQTNGQPMTQESIWNWPRVLLRHATGEVKLSNVVPTWQPFTPLADGKPILKDVVPLQGACQNRTLALAVHGREGKKSCEIRLFRGPDGIPLVEYPSDGLEYPAPTLSADGRWLAWRKATRQVEIRDTHSRATGCVFPPLGRFHHNIDVVLGKRWLTLQIGRTTHLVCWHDGRLEHRHTRDRGNVFPQQTLEQRGLSPQGERATPDWTISDRFAYDPRRFVRAAVNEVIAVVDCYGEVILFERTGQLLCMMFALQNRMAFWLSDGTCAGAPALLGRPASPGAEARIGQALLRASERWTAFVP